MAIKLRLIGSDPEVFAELGDSFAGGVLALKVTANGSCPVVIYGDVADTDEDSLSIRAIRAVANIYEFYDTDNPPPDPTLIPVCTTPIVTINPTASLLTNGDTLFPLTIDNASTYRIEFSTNRIGTIDEYGYPVTWDEVDKDAQGRFLVKTASSSTGVAQSVRARFVGCAQVFFNSYVPATPEEVILPPPSGTNAVVRAKPILLSFWGNGGEATPSAQGTDEDERWILSQPQFAHALPFYGTRGTIQNVETTNWVAGVDMGKIYRNVNCEYDITQEAMDSIIEYVVRGGLQGFDFMYYANDATLSQTRKKYVLANNKRGTKMAYTVLSLGGDGNNYGVFPYNQYTESIYEIALHMTYDYYQKINGVPLIAYLVPPDFHSNTSKKNEVSTVLGQIKDRYKSLMGITDPSFNFYRVMTGEPYLDNQQAVIDLGYDAVSNYYIYGGYDDNNFAEVLGLTQSYINTGTYGKAIPLQLGLDSRGRIWYKYQDGGDNYYNRASVNASMGALIDIVLAGLSSGANNKLAYARMADENTEQGISGMFIPTLNNGYTQYEGLVSIDRGINDIFKNKLNSNYIDP